MNTKFELKEVSLTQEEFSDLVSAGTYGTYIKLIFIGDEEEVKNFKKENKGMYYEDLCAKWLYEGHKLGIHLDDYSGECDDEDDESLFGAFDKELMEQRLVEGYNNGQIKRNLDNFIKEQYDAIDGMNILQYITFKEIVVG